MKFERVVWDRWSERIEDVVNDFQYVALDQHVFEQFRALVVANGAWLDENYGGVFLELVRRSYLSHVVIGVRRHLPEKDKGSLAKILDQLSKCASQITYDFYTEVFPVDPEMPPWQHDVFSRLSQDGQVVSKDLVDQDLAELQRLGAACRALANSSIAHLDPKDVKVKLTYADVDASVNGISELVCKYRLFLSGISRDKLMPTIQEPWERVFDVPFKKPDAGDAA